MSVRDFPFPPPPNLNLESFADYEWRERVGERLNIDLQQELTSVASGDELYVFDVSETGAVKTKKATVANVVAGAGAVIGPASATDNAVMRWNGTGGDSAQDSAFIIDDSGHVSSFGGQIKFPATQAASSDVNTLDDYEEGTSTITLKGIGSDPTTPVTTTAYYTKIGRVVKFDYQFSNVDTTGASGAAYCSGLPFSAAQDAVSTVMSYAALVFTEQVVAYITSTNIYYYQVRSAASWTASTHSAGATRYIYQSGAYITST